MPNEICIAAPQWVHLASITRQLMIKKYEPNGGQTTQFILGAAGESDLFYYFTGKTFDGKKESWYGNRGWLGELKLYRESVKVIDLMNTIFLNSIQHHYPIVLQNVSDYIEEFAYWLDLKKIKKIGYERFMYV